MKFYCEDSATVLQQVNAAQNEGLTAAEAEKRLLEHGENKEHKVEIRLVETHSSDVVPFYLVSVIGS